MEKEKILKEAIKTYGADAQLTVAVEELSELIKEICKLKRGEINYINIAEEMADCYIMLYQMRLIFENDAAVSEFISAKLRRLERRLRECQ